MPDDVEKSLVNHTPTVDLVQTKNARNGTAVIVNNKSSRDDVDDVLVGADHQHEPQDGGTRAWIIMVGSFFCNGILFGVINSYSVLHSEFHENFVALGVDSPSSKAALVGALAMGTMFLVSPVSGVLTDIIGLRRTALLGGMIASSGMFLSSFCINNVQWLCFTFGVMYGLGGALAYTPSLAILGHYFKKYLGIVNGVVTSGSSVFTIVMPYIIDASLRNIGLVWTLRVLALIASFLMVFAFLFKPTARMATNHTKNRAKINAAFNTDLWKNRKYVTWAAVIALSLFGYFVPYVYILEFVGETFGKGVDGKLPVLCIGITSGIGRLLFGYVADLPWVNRILLQQIAFFSIGILTLLLPFSTSSFALLIAITLGMGLFDGCFISLLGPIAFDICGQSGATQAIGFLLGMCSVPLTVGPYVAGVIYDHQKSFTLPFILAGIPPTIGSVLMFLTRVVKKKKTDENARIDNQHQPKAVTNSESTDIQGNVLLSEMISNQNY